MTAGAFAAATCRPASRARPPGPAHEATSERTPGGRIDGLSISAPSAYYPVYTQGVETGQIVYTDTEVVA